MSYSAPTAKAFREKPGSLSDKLVSEFSSIASEITTHATSKFVVLTAGVGTPTALATAGIDLASGSNIQIYGAFVAPVNITVLKMHDYLTEAYVKETTDAKLEILDDAGSPNTIFTRTLTAAGEAAKAFHSTSPESGKASIAAGTRLDLKATNSASSTGTGHAVVILEYVEND